MEEVVRQLVLSWDFSSSEPGKNSTTSSEPVKNSTTSSEPGKNTTTSSEPGKNSTTSSEPGTNSTILQTVRGMSSVEVLKQILLHAGSNWTMNHTKSVCYCLTLCSTEWLAPVIQQYKQSPSFKKTFLDILLQIILSAEIPELAETEIYEYDNADFEGCTEKSTCAMQFVLTFVKVFTNLKAEWVIRDVMKTVMTHVVVLVFSNCEQAPWTSNKSIQVTADLKLALSGVYQCRDFGEVLLIGPDKDSNLETESITVETESITVERNSTIRQTLEYLRPRVKKAKWKRNPFYLKAFVGCLFQTKLPYVGDLLGELLPVTLTLVDDHVTVNKQLGVTCLLHIINNTSRTELLWQSRADVIYEAVKLQLYSKEISLLEEAIPCMLAILDVLEPPSRHTNQDASDVFSYQGTTKYDQIFRMILVNADMESRLALRRTYTKYLCKFIQRMGINVVKHSQSLLRLVVSYLETYDGPSEIARLNTLTVLDAFVVQAWPRITYHSATILKSLIRLVYDISVDSTLTPANVKLELTDKAKGSLLLLKQVCPAEVEECLRKVSELETTPQCAQLIKQVLEAPT